MFRQIVMRINGQIGAENESIEMKSVAGILNCFFFQLAIYPVPILVKLRWNNCNHNLI